MITTTTLIYLLASTMSGVTAWLFGRRKWDGLLQWLLVTQNAFIAIIMGCRAFETLGYINSDSVDSISATSFFLIQTWIAWFLWTNTTLSDSKEEKKKKD